jgi:anthranilate synthase component 1
VSVSLETPLSSILGDRSAKSLKTAFGYTLVGDILTHYPRRYATRGELTSIAGIPLGDMATLVGEVVSVSQRTMKAKRGSVLEAVITDGTVIETDHGNPLDFIASYHARFKVFLQDGLPRFCGGLAGYFGYDTIRYIEPRLAKNSLPDEINTPDIQMMLTEELAVIDNLAGKLYLIVYANPQEPATYDAAQKRLKELLVSLDAPIKKPHSGPSAKTETIRRFGKENFIDAVKRTKEYILAGDCMQVVIGQRISQPYSDPPLSLYRALRSLNPSPYMYLYDFGDHQVVGSSPEILVRQEKRRIDGQEKRFVIVRPIAGTRPRGINPEQDAQLAEELLADPKEIAEHVMLIDLARNDVGRIAKNGTVKVTDRMVIEKYSHVQHIVSSVEGELLNDASNMDVLKATFPAGTLSGAPKIRAMEIIDEMEIVKRGVYGGAAGYLSFSGDMDVAIVIRTGVIKDGMVHAQAGAGVVADSDPESEWKETEAKARAVMRAVEMVQGGLDAGND